MTENAHFVSVASFEDAREMLTFQPREPAVRGDPERVRLRIFVRDHKMRELAIADRSLEAYYDRFVFTQSRKGVDEARRLALDVSYGRDPRPGAIGGHAAKMYERGPEPEPGDPDARMPAVVTWHDGEMFFLLASGELPVQDLITIAQSIHSPRAT